MNTVKQNPSDFPDGLSLLPEPPKGKAWSYRGMGWNNGGNKATYICSFNKGDWDREYSDKIPGRDTTLHYAELVDTTPNNTQQEYEYFDGKGQICQGNEEWLVKGSNFWKETSCRKGDGLSSTLKYRRPIGIFTKEYQAELAKQWVLKGGFEREHIDNGDWIFSGANSWIKGVIYRRKPQLTQEELDAQAAKEYSKSATIQTDATVIEKAYMEGMKHERNRIK